MKKILLLVSFISFLGIAEGLQAQSTPWQFRLRAKDVGYTTIGAHIGFFNYFGDLNPWASFVSTDLRRTRPSVGIYIARKFTPRIQGRIGLSYGRLTANDFQAADPNDERHRFRYIRNNHFRNDLFELSVVMTYDFFANLFVFHKRVKFTPYALIGVAGFFHDPRAKVPLDYSGPGGTPGEWVRLRPLRTEGQGLTRQSANSPNFGVAYDKPYSLIQPAIPVGLGVRFRLSDRIDMSVEAAYRFTFTDYLDDVSGNYADPRDLLNQVGPLSLALSNRTLEPFDAESGSSREADLVRFVTEANPIIPDASGNLTIAGYGNDGDKRGESGNTDIYILTAVHFTYILGNRVHCPVPRR